jgi:hypothetical protein
MISEKYIVELRKMGIGSSKISSDDFLLSRKRDELLQLTREPRSFSDQIFLYLKNNMHISSYINILGNEQSCNKFIFILASDLTKIFEHLPIKISQDKKGHLLFSSIDDIVKREDTQQYTKQYCKYVAHFVTRLFQIYGALAMSVLDNEAIRDMTADTSVQGIISEMPVRQLGFRTGQQGGDQLNEIIFNIFKQSVPYFKMIDNNATYNMEYNKYLFNINYKVDKGVLKVVINSFGTKDSEYDISHYKKGSRHFKTIVQNAYIVNNEFIKNNINVIVKTTIELLDSFIKLVVKKDEIRGEQYKDPIYGIERPGITVQNDLYSTLVGEKNKKIIPRPTPHCVARALQLLSFQSSKTAPRTAICKKSFLGLKAGESSVGIKSLIDLFFAVEKQNGSRLALPDSQAKYQELLKYFADGKIKSIDCGTKTNAIGTVKPEAKTEISKASNAIIAMYKYQAEHTAKVAKIYELLFNVKKDKVGGWQVLGINPKVYEGGTEYLENTLMPAIRNLLVDYYSKCEQIYDVARLELVSKLN